MRVEKKRVSRIWIIIAVSIALATIIALLHGHLSSNVKHIVLDSSNHIVKKIGSPSLAWQKVVVKKGDTLAAIFSRLKIGQGDLIRLIKQHKSLAALRPNETLYFQIKPPHQLFALKYPLSTAKIMMITRQDKHFAGKIYHKPVTTTLAYKSLTIHHSLSQDAKKAGLSYQMISELQTIFGGKVNFSRDIHQGDRFDFLYQEKSIDGKKYRDGDIVAAEFNHRGKVNEAIRYTYPVKHTAYYTPDGRGVEPRFLRAPLHYKRISSHFSYHRYDPVVHKVRPHLGVDFAACKGTPIKSIGDGRVVFIGRDGGYGKAVKIRYGRHYLALYGHMWHFAKIKLHQWVHKGQIIGYVGETGWATGPHLHFGFYINGKAKNWLAMKLPAGRSIPQNYEKRFLNKAKQLLAELHLHQDTQLAANNYSVSEK